MTAIKVFRQIVSRVKTEQNYIPRNYQTIGGMWTTDTWKEDKFTVRVMDEGYTTSLSSENWTVTNLCYPTVDTLKFEGITEEEFCNQMCAST